MQPKFPIFSFFIWIIFVINSLTCLSFYTFALLKLVLVINYYHHTTCNFFHANSKSWFLKSENELTSSLEKSKYLFLVRRKKLHQDCHGHQLQCCQCDHAARTVTYQPRFWSYLIFPELAKGFSGSGDINCYSGYICYNKNYYCSKKRGMRTF